MSTLNKRAIEKHVYTNYFASILKSRHILTQSEKQIDTVRDMCQDGKNCKIHVLGLGASTKAQQKQRLDKIASLAFLIMTKTRPSSCKSHFNFRQVWEGVVLCCQ